MSKIDPELIKLTNEVAKTFVTTYYTALDTHRGTLAGFYQPSASIVWNGTPLSGGDAFAHFFATMPVSVTDVQSYDAHPIGGTPAMVSLSVSGTVKYGAGAKEQRGFSETVVLVGDGEGTGRGKWRIGSQGFRV
ncbi:hypothetical protein EDC01DRAFT_789157, partial [Geopyxis carbonaria]